MKSSSTNETHNVRFRFDSRIWIRIFSDDKKKCVEKNRKINENIQKLSIPIRH